MMQRYNHTAAGMVPADGGDWVKADDVMPRTANLSLFAVTDPTPYELAEKINDIIRALNNMWAEKVGA